LYLRVAQMPRCSDLAIFVLIDKQTNGQTEPIALPLAHARGVISHTGCAIDCIVSVVYSN
jgi:hypothetical protein